MSAVGINYETFAEHLGRMQFCGVPWAVTDLLLRLMPEPTWEAWGVSCERLGDERRAANPGVAMACLHFAQFKSRDVDLKRPIQAEVRELWRDVGAASGLDVTSLDIWRRGDRYPALLVEAPGREHDARPCSTVILVNGLDSVKEVELWTFAKAFIRGGVARCLLLDGPGQGEARVERGHVLDDFDGMIPAAIDAVRSLGRPCRLPIVFGVSLGGFLALRAAQATDGLGATLCFSCGTDWNHLPRLPAALLDLFRFALGLPEGGDIAAALSAVLRLDVARAPRCPTLIVHGTRDRVMPVAGSEALMRRHPKRIDLVEHDDGHMFLHHLGTSIPSALRWAFSKTRVGCRQQERKLHV